MNIAGEYFKIISERPYNSESFCSFLRSFIENLRNKNVIRGVFVMDNVRFHHCHDVAAVIEGSGF